MNFYRYLALGLISCFSTAALGQNCDVRADSTTSYLNSISDLNSTVSIDSDASADLENRPRKMSLLRRIIRGFDRLDTAYIEPQHYVFTAMLQATHTYDLYMLRSRGQNLQEFTFAPDMNMKLGPYFGWKWFFAGYTFELKDVNAKNLKDEFTLSIYSSQIGIDLFYRRTGNNYKLRNVSLGSGLDTKPLENVPFSGVKAGITGFNIYYIFNHGHFSYPAAFSQSTIQKISCGSWMAGIGYTQNSLSLNYKSLQNLVNDKLSSSAFKLDEGLMIDDVRYHDMKVSGGYAYNWVFAKSWLLAASLQAALAYKYSVADNKEGRDNGFDFKNVNVDGVGRFGLVYNNMRWFAGMNIILNSYNYRKPRFATSNIFGSMNLYVGYNFGLKKKYKK